MSIKQSGRQMGALPKVNMSILIKFSSTVIPKKPQHCSVWRGQVTNEGNCQIRESGYEST